VAANDRRDEGTVSKASTYILEMFDSWGVTNATFLPFPLTPVPLALSTFDIGAESRDSVVSCKGVFEPESSVDVGPCRFCIGTFEIFPVPVTDVESPFSLPPLEK